MPDFDLWCVLEGRGWLRLGQKRHEVSAGQCVLLQPGSLPQGGHDPQNPLTVFACHFDLLGDRKALRELPPCDEPRPFPDGLLLEQMARHALRSHRFDQHSPAGRTELALWQILLGLIPYPPSTPPLDHRVERCIEAIEGAPAKPWTIDSLAILAGVSRAHFSRLFVEAIGESPIQFAIRIRIARAQTLLTETHMSVAEIAEALGYRDVFFFTRQFRQMTGLPPARHRACHSR